MRNLLVFYCPYCLSPLHNFDWCNLEFRSKLLFLIYIVSFSLKTFLKFSLNLQHFCSLFPQIILPSPQDSNMLNHPVLFHRSLMLDSCFKKKRNFIRDHRHAVPIAKYLKTFVSCILSSVPAVYGKKVNLSSVTLLRLNTEVDYFSSDLLSYISQSHCFLSPFFPTLTCVSKTAESFLLHFNDSIP